MATINSFNVKIIQGLHFRSRLINVSSLMIAATPTINTLMFATVEYYPNRIGLTDLIHLQRIEVNLLDLCQPKI